MVQLNQQEVLLVFQEIEEMPRKVAIQKVQASPCKFLNSTFVVPKKDTGHCPVVNLKKLNRHIPYEHFKRKGLFLLKEVLQSGGYICRIDLKVTDFLVPLHLESQTFARFQWRVQLF